MSREYTEYKDPYMHECILLPTVDSINLLLPRPGQATVGLLDHVAELLIGTLQEKPVDSALPTMSRSVHFFFVADCALLLTYGRKR